MLIIMQSINTEMLWKGALIHEFFRVGILGNFSIFDKDKPQGHWDLFDRSLWQISLKN